MKKTKWQPVIIALALSALVSVFSYVGCGGGSSGGSSAPAPDTTAPTISSVSPLSNSTTALISANISVTFSEAMSQTAVQGAFSISPSVAGAFSWSGNIMTFNPTDNLDYSAPYTCTVSVAAKDSAGNALASQYQWGFTTVPDTTLPTILSVGPLDSAASVALNAAITATFSETMDASTVTTATFTLSGAVTGTVTCSGATATFTPAANLSVFTVYTATITTGVTDLAGNALAVNYEWSFTTGASSFVPGTVSAIQGGTIFNQTVACLDPDDSVSVFPGQANYWDIQADFSLLDGYDDQFDSALMLDISGTSFAADQTYSELTFMTPVLTATDGVIAAAAVPKFLIEGVYSGQLNGISDARLQQTLDLTGATVPITLTWSDSVTLGTGNIPGDTSYFRVVIRDTNGALLETISTAGSGTAATATLTAYAGQTIVLSFEQRSGYGNYSNIDLISVTDNAAVSYITNGDFEAGNLTGWTTQAQDVVQNMTSGARLIEGLTVTRSFYTVPNKLWGRWVDVFENNTITDTNVTVTYTTDLGSDFYGIIYETPGCTGTALTSWDGSNSDRDVGLVFGTADNVQYLSDDVMGNGNGDEFIYVSYNITVTAGSRAAIVNFIIMDGTDTGNIASDETELAVDIDGEAVNIVTDFWSDPQYRNGMTQSQIDAIVNF